MAHFKINKHFSFGSTTLPNASSWQVALDSEFKIIIDETIEDNKNITTWTSPLPKKDGSGFYSDLSKFYCRVKYHTYEFESDWYVLPNDNNKSNQNIQMFIITKNNVIVNKLNSLTNNIG